MTLVCRNHTDRSGATKLALTHRQWLQEDKFLSFRCKSFRFKRTHWRHRHYSFDELYVFRFIHLYTACICCPFLSDVTIGYFTKYFIKWIAFDSIETNIHVARKTNELNLIRNFVNRIHRCLLPTYNQLCVIIKSLVTLLSLAGDGRMPLPKLSNGTLGDSVA